jgi:hypothetical protein
MKSNHLRRISFYVLLVLSVLSISMGNTVAAAQTVDCTGGQSPNMTIVIYNNSTDFNIYPVLFAGAPSPTDTWMQACFKLTDAQVNSGDFPYPRETQYRMYIACCAEGENGIAPGGSVTITLPLYSPLVNPINPKLAGQLIDWWQGGGINFYKSAAGTTPPAELQQHWNNDQTAGRNITPVSNPPSCAGCTLHFFIAPNSIPNYDPQQLTEYTLGAQPVNPDHAMPQQPARLWVPDNVDYDVSYVNYVYMPAVMEPFENPLIGYIGSPSRIADVTSAIDSWLGSSLGSGWPLYKGSDGSTVPGKAPSALEIFLNTSAFDNTSVFIPAPAESAPIMAMEIEWKTCAGNPGGGAICPLINDVTALLQANYDHYEDVGLHDPHTWTYVWQCKGDPVKESDRLTLAHLYGWTPFIENCANTAANQLYDTPGYNDPSRNPNYQMVKDEFDQLQYWVNVLKGDYGTFDPYVALVHGPTYINAPYTYAYSVDDAVGNMQTDGTGLVIAVGGPEHLPNPDHATPNVNFPFGYHSPYNGGIDFTEYGRCTMTPDTATVSYFTSFAIPEGIVDTPSSIVNCPISMKDSEERVYHFKLKDQPNAFPTNPFPTPEERMEANSRFIDCSLNSGQQLNWCQTIYPYQQVNANDQRATVNYYVVMAAPPPLN